MVNELNLDPRTYVKIKDIDVEVVEGELSEKPWFIESKGKIIFYLKKSNMISLLVF